MDTVEGSDDWRVVGRCCPICGETIDRMDVAMYRRHDGEKQWCHFVHCEDAVNRWVREGKPYDSPLEWDRQERPHWVYDHRKHGTVWSHTHRVRGNRDFDSAVIRRVPAPWPDSDDW